MRDLVSKLDHEVVLNAVVSTTTPTCTGVDCADALSVTHLVNIGESGDTLSGSVYLTVILQESVDNSAWTTVADDDVILRNGNTIIATNSVVIDAAAEDDVVLGMGYIGNKQYSRPLITLTGTHTNGIPLAASAVKESKIIQPAI